MQNITIKQEPICLVLWPPVLHTQQTKPNIRGPTLFPKKSRLPKANLAEAVLQGNFEEKQLLCFVDR